MNESEIQHRQLSISLHRSKKERECVSCKASIQPGENYFNEVAIHEGQFGSRCYCEKCGRELESLESVK